MFFFRSLLNCNSGGHTWSTSLQQLKLYYSVLQQTSIQTKRCSLKRTKNEITSLFAEEKEMNKWIKSLSAATRNNHNTYRQQQQQGGRTCKLEVIFLWVILVWQIGVVQEKTPNIIRAGSHDWFHASCSSLCTLYDRIDPCGPMWIPLEQHIWNYSWAERRKSFGENLLR